MIIHQHRCQGRWKNVAAILTILTGLVLFSCASHKPQVKPSPLFEQKIMTETELFRKAAPGNRPHLLTLNTGEVEVSTALLLNLQQTTDIQDRKLYVPVLAHLVRHPKQGDILIDTGFDSSFSRSGHGNFGCLAKLVNIARQNQGQDIRAQLLQHKADVSAVYFTHMHGDHTSGVPELPQTIPYYAGKGTLADSYDDLPGVCMNHLDNIREILEIDFTAEVEISGLGKTIDLLGDGTLWGISTPGHSAGHISYLVIAHDGPVLVTGDASHTGYGFQRNIPPGKMIDAAAGANSLRLLREFAARNPQVRVIFGHDPEGNLLP